MGASFIDSQICTSYIFQITFLNNKEKKNQLNKGIFNRKLFLKIYLKLSNVKIMNFTYSSFTSGVRYLWDLLFIAEQEGLRTAGVLSQGQSYHIPTLRSAVQF